MKSVLKNKAITLALTALTVVGSESEKESDASFINGSFEEALEQAKQEELPLFVY